jgi:hypothetical protein
MKHRVAPRLAARWGIGWLLLPLLGGCGGLFGLPGAPQERSPEAAIPPPFENYPPARMPAFKRPPPASPSPDARTPASGTPAPGLRGGDATR